MVGELACGRLAHHHERRSARRDADHRRENGRVAESRRWRQGWAAPSDSIPTRVLLEGHAACAQILRSTSMCTARQTTHDHPLPTGINYPPLLSEIVLCALAVPLCVASSRKIWISQPPHVLERPSVLHAHIQEAWLTWPVLCPSTAPQALLLPSSRSCILHL